MKYQVIHKTEYQYQHPLSLSYNVACILPCSNIYQNCLSSNLEVSPSPSFFQENIDFFGNRQSFFNIQQAHSKLSIIANSQIEVYELDNMILANSKAWESVCKEDLDYTQYMIKQYCLDSPLIHIGQQFYDYAKPSFTPKRPLLLAVKELMQRIYEDFEYTPNFTSISTPLQDVMLHKKGVCQDFAHLAIACIRSMGLPAQYVSGYLETLPPPGKPKIVGSDASHAWFAAYDPAFGWVEFDPTNNQQPTNQYIRTAYGRDYSDVTPLKGILFGGSSHQLNVSVDVSRI
ncbi:MAG: transglutaminase family protein [Gammaproteobacteria bacterium]|nr:transglutaminase family protein [Gammaproteobacteria bacterium]